MRICSFLPSGTEIVCALGLSDSLLAVSHECDYPAEVLSRPKVVRSRFDSAKLTGAEIDAAVAGLASRGERIYEVDRSVLEAARPDLVITQQLCEVCAVSFEDVQAAVVQLEVPPRIISLDPSSLSDVLSDVEAVGEATGTSAQAMELTNALSERIEAVASKRSPGAPAKKVACIEWLDPIIVAGHWIPEMVRLAGGVDVLAEPGAASRRITFDELAAGDPDVLVLMPCGMGVDRAIERAVGGGRPGPLGTPACHPPGRRLRRRRRLAIQPKRPSAGGWPGAPCAANPSRSIPRPATGRRRPSVGGPPRSADPPVGPATHLRHTDWHPSQYTAHIPPAPGLTAGHDSAIRHLPKMRNGMLRVFLRQDIVDANERLCFEIQFFDFRPQKLLQCELPRQYCTKIESVHQEY